MKNGTVETAHGRLSYLDSGGAGPAVLFIHGNSSCKEIFGRQLESGIGRDFRCIAFDLPGHGASSDAPEPEKTYSIHGFADASMALLDGLGIERATAIGWSLGGHAALEMMGRWPGTVAAWITGTPPAGGADMGEAFLPSEHMALTFAESFTAEQAAIYAQETIGAGVALEPWMVAGCARADGRFRPLMLQSVAAGLDMDGREIAATSPLPLAVVSGALEPFVNNAFLTSISYRNLWDGKVHILEGLAHMPFWQAPDVVNPLLARFLAEVN
ncbi:MAG: alpha/beta hydrolase [Parvibaculum sp.]|uniref:alpha/beta fold hydrolase n=1 Tax=Parvibaculum sp. TaxID=2024848 RepID=UPI00263891B8|nr:alpha/beta hydrolase [Parvibaculum sp.]MBX3496290.1 alpha/beta hydrolase [Parvibaculum sp.]MCW5727288.1 alpha/beta hydrolase [Parvibaculum sp.]